MAFDILMPKMGESVQEGTILRWLKQTGDKIERDEIIAEISTDKVDTEIPSPYEGVLGEIFAPEGATVAVGVVIARMAGEQVSEQTNKQTNEQPVEQTGGQAASATLAGNSSELSSSQQAQVPEQPTGSNSKSSSNNENISSSQEPVLMPKMGESVQEGTILRWLKQIGDKIKRDEIIAEISTDKVDTEIPSPLAGTLVEIVANEGSVVPVNEVIAYISTGVSASQSAGASQNSASVSNTQTNVAVAANLQTNGATMSNSPQINAEHTGPIPRVSNGKFYSPLVRSIAEKENVSVIELDSIQGNGEKGRVTKSDLLNYIANRGKATSSKPATTTQQAVPQANTTSQNDTVKPTQQKPVASVTASSSDIEVVPMDRMRQLIAEHMVRSKQVSPHVSGVAEADVSKMVSIREKNKSAFEKREGVKLTYTPFFLYAVAKALKNNPWVNASVEGTNVLVKKHINVGMATALPDGNLIVPVIKDADRLSLSGLAHAVNDLATKARTKALSPDDIAGGTFTVTNYGVFGMLHGAPIINQPQVAILGTGAIQKKPVVREIEGMDMIVIRSMVYLSISHDHRIVDGMLAGKFLSEVVSILESIDETIL